jgi:hypothetical protein
VQAVEALSVRVFEQQTHERGAHAASLPFVRDGYGEFSFRRAHVSRIPRCAYEALILDRAYDGHERHVVTVINMDEVLNQVGRGFTHMAHQTIVSGFRA